MNIGNFQRLFQYEAWANREAIAALRRAKNPPSRAVETMAHIIGAGALWYTRLQHQPAKMAVWPQFTLEGLGPELERLSKTWQGYLPTLTPEKLSGKIEYVNSKGEPWTSTVGDILMHVILHSSYHRGQVAQLLRQGGDGPAYTDYIHAVRQGLLAETSFD